MTWQDIALKHAEKNAPHEACGLLAVYKGKEKYFPCKNLAEDLGEQFIIDPDDWVKAEDAGEVIAVFHSHPQIPPFPSQADLASCEYLDLPFYIVTPETKEWYYFEPSGYRKGLIGRQWVWGVQDCWNLVHDWYEEKKNITLKHWERPASSFHGKFNSNHKNNIFTVDGNAYFNRSGPRILDSLEILSYCLHPEIFPEFFKKYKEALIRLEHDLKVPTN